MCDLHQKHFQNPEAAREYLEKQVWPDGPICPHCGVIKDRMSRIEGGRPGLWFCGHCRQQFTVTVGSVFERSKIPLHKWLLAVHLLCSSKKGMSSHQLHRMLGVTYKTAWFMTHRIREAFKLPNDGKLGGGGKVVEADETFYGAIAGRTYHGGSAHKHKIFSLVERDGTTRSFHVANIDEKTLKPILLKQVEQNTDLYTDTGGQYRKIKGDFPKHEMVNHSIGEYARGDIHTNTVESYFGVLKRGLTGTYQHVSEAHLQRYVTEFDFRFSHRTALGFSDAERARIALTQIRGKRLTYRRIDGAPQVQNAPVE